MPNLRRIFFIIWNNSLGFFAPRSPRQQACKLNLVYSTSCKEGLQAH